MRRQKTRDLFHGSFLSYADDLLAHDRFYLFPLFAYDVGLGGHPDDLAILIAHGNTANVVFGKQDSQLSDRGRRAYREHIFSHNVLGYHLFSASTCCSGPADPCTRYFFFNITWDKASTAGAKNDVIAAVADRPQASLIARVAPAWQITAERERLRA